MGIVRAAVLLYGWTAGQQLQVPDREFYERYFFHPVHGQAAHWAKQTDNQVALTGQVFDWAFDTDPNPQLTNRTDVVNNVISTLQDSRDIGFGGIDLIFLVLGVPASVPSDGGSTTARSNTRSHAAVVMRLGDRFDFVGHEIGHALGLLHSFGPPSFHLADTKPGEYGHPYCVMSAMAYGGTGGPSFPTPPWENAREYNGQGPSLNAATALDRGWLDAHDYPLDGAQVRQFVVRSRSWGGRLAHLAPQAVNVRGGDGQNYVIEYRENVDWDLGQGSPVLIVNHGHGSTGDRAYPDRGTATFLSLIRLPITLGGTGAVYQGPGFGVQMLTVSSSAHTVTFNLFPGRAPHTPFQLDQQLNLVEEQLLESGVTDFGVGTRICLEGVWPYRKLSQAQVATFDATYPLAVQPIYASWSANGEPLTGTTGTISLITTVKVATADLADLFDTRFVSIRYEIERLPTGSRLRLFNQPVNESYSVDVAVTLRTDIGSAVAETSVKFVGIRYAYPHELYEERSACLASLVRKRIPQYKVLIPPGSWQKNPEERFVEVEGLLNTLAVLYDHPDRQAFLQTLVLLHDLTGVSPDQVQLMRLDDIQELDHPEPIFEPPAPETADLIDERD